MILIMKIIGIALGFIFPALLTKAVNAQQEDSEKSKYTALSCLCFGMLIFIIMGLLPNS